MADVTIANETTYDFPEVRIKTLIEVTCHHESRWLDAVSVSVVTPEEIRRVNRHLRGKDTPTDVLSFPFDDSFPHGAGGELLVAPAVAEKSINSSHPINAEIDLLIVHGTLHLLGYEDETEQGRRLMEQRTGNVLQAAHG